MSTQRSSIESPAAGVPVADLHDPQLFALDEQAEPAVTTAPASPEDGAAVVLDMLPGKRPLVRLSAQPLNYESPIDYLGAAITPNEAFFVRYNLSDVPRIDADRWTLAMGGPGAHAHAETRLPDLAGVRDEALEIVFAGADKDGCNKTPDFSKSLPVWKAREDTTLVAYEMNGRPLPHLHGFPARLVVPGWTAPYWVKHVAAIAVATAPCDGYWMRSTYRVPLGTFPAVARFASQENAVDTPITEMMVNSLLTAPHDGASVKAQAQIDVAGVAWDGGHGVSGVDVSIDGGRAWTAAVLGEAQGRFAFRTWRQPVRLGRKGSHVITARATNRVGQTQPAYAIVNPSGYHHNAVQRLTLIAT